MDKEQSACKCIEYITLIAKKMEYEHIANSEDIISLGNSVLGDCLDKFDPNKSPDFILFFKKMFLFSVKDFNRKKSKNPEFSFDSGEYEDQDWIDNRIISVSKKESYRLLRQLIKRLSDFERKVIVMKIVDKMSQKDIAFLVGKTEARISQVIPSALEKIRNMPESKDLQNILRETYD